jgi:hypothetical protein
MHAKFRCIALLLPKTFMAIRKPAVGTAVKSDLNKLASRAP